MAGLLRRNVHAFMASVAGTTVLTGLYLYWHFTDGFDPGISSTMGGRVFGLGGLLGITAAAIGGSLVARNLKKAGALMAQAAGQSDATARGQILAQAGQHRQRAHAAAKVVSVLLIVTIMLMALGHYV